MPFHIPHHRIISCHLVMPGAIGRHDAVLFLQLLSNSARCISGVCAAKRCRVSKQSRCDVAVHKFCRILVPYRRLSPGSGPQPGGLSALSPSGKGPAGGSAGRLGRQLIQNGKAHDCESSQGRFAFNPSVSLRLTAPFAQGSLWRSEISEPFSKKGRLPVASAQRVKKQVF